MFLLNQLKSQAKLSKAFLILSLDSSCHHPLKKTLVTLQNRDPSKMSFKSNLDLCRDVFFKAIDSVIPKSLIKTQLKLSNGKILQILEHPPLDLEQFSKINVIGFGKAVLPMAEALLELLHDSTIPVNRCVLSIPVGSRTSQNSAIEIHTGARNNIPDADAAKAAREIVKLVSSTSSTDLLFVLISGGGSALLPYPKAPITLEEKTALISKLSKNGATIQELNHVRRKISVVKGGGLLAYCTEAKQVISLILSDVLGDELETIASGPTVISASNFNMEQNSALNIVKSYIPSYETSIAESIRSILACEETIDRTENVKVQNILIGTNEIALKEAAKAASATSIFHPVIVTSKFHGSARTNGQNLARLSLKILEALNFASGQRLSFDDVKKECNALNFEQVESERLVSGVDEAIRVGKGLCLILGGETTVLVRGNGIGGRNQELALSACLELRDSNFGITIGSCGTDGIDGPCDAAGAIVDSTTLKIAQEMNINPLEYLNNNDSYEFFKRINRNYHIFTGHTETNVMDIILVFIEPFLNKVRH